MENAPLRTILIDDEPEAIYYLETLLLANKEIQIVASIQDSRLAIEKIIRHAPDLIFLDIQMPSLNGFEIVSQLKEYHQKVCVVFITAFDHHAIQAIKAGAFDYLMKPVDQSELKIAIEKVRNHMSENNLHHRIELIERALKNNHKIRFNTRSAYILLHPSDIFYIEADANYSDIYISKTRREVVSMNLGSIEAILPPQFIRISRSVIINTDYLVKVSGALKTCYLQKDGEEICLEIPKQNISDVKNLLSE